MTFRTLLGSAALAVVMTACGNADKTDNGQAGLPANASTADSVMYYFGQMRAAEYWRQAQSDTTMAEEQARQAYLRGIRAGIDAVRDADGDVYNQGVLMGVQMAMNMSDFNKSYQADVNKNIVLQSLAAGLKDETVAENRDIQKEFYALMGRLNAERDARNLKASAEAVRAEGRKLGMQPVDSTLYFRVLNPSDGRQLQQGERVRVTVNVRRLDGSEVNVRMPHEITIGDRYVSAPLSKGVATMRAGETKEFLTTASCLLGQRTAQMDMEPAELLMVSIATETEASEQARKAAPALEKTDENLRDELARTSRPDRPARPR